MLRRMSKLSVCESHSTHYFCTNPSKYLPRTRTFHELSNTEFLNSFVLCRPYHVSTDVSNNTAFKDEMQINDVAHILCYYGPVVARHSKIYEMKSCVLDNEWNHYIVRVLISFWAFASLQSSEKVMMIILSSQLSYGIRTRKYFTTKLITRHLHINEVCGQYLLMKTLLNW